MKSRTLLKITKMVKKIFGWLWIVGCILAVGVMLLPVALIMHTDKEGNLDGWSLIGLAWLAGIVWWLCKNEKKE